MSTPARPAVFDPFHAPDGVECRWVEFWMQRPLLGSVRSTLVHTNAASREGSVAAAWNFAHARPNANTCPHYQVDRKHEGVWVRKMLPSNRRGIGNATVDAHQEGRGDISTWSLVIETADLGWGEGRPGGACGFEEEQGEMVAAILAYESIVHGFPLSIIETWWGAGVAAHTDPFGYPYTTLYAGKVCPGETKKRELREWIYPRAAAIREAWTAAPVVVEPPVIIDPTPVDQEVSMLTLDLGKPGVDSWWTRCTWTGAQLSWVQGEADHVLRRVGVRVVEVSEPELLAIIRSSETVTPSPFAAGGQAPNAMLHQAWLDAAPG